MRGGRLLFSVLKLDWDGTEMEETREVKWRRRGMNVEWRRRNRGLRLCYLLGDSKGCHPLRSGFKEEWHYMDNFLIQSYEQARRFGLRYD